METTLQDILECLVTHGEKLLQAIGLAEMKRWYGDMPVNAWYNACHKCN